MSKTVHYRHPKFGYHACGMGDRHLVLMTDNPEEVTCKRCKSTVTGQANGGRPRHGLKAKVDTKVRIDPDLKARAKEAGLNLSELLEWAIAHKLNL